MYAQSTDRFILGRNRERAAAACSKVEIKTTPKQDESKPLPSNIISYITKVNTFLVNKKVYSVHEKENK